MDLRSSLVRDWPSVVAGSWNECIRFKSAVLPILRAFSRPGMLRRVAKAKSSDEDGVSFIVTDNTTSVHNEEHNATDSDPEP